MADYVYANASCAVRHPETGLIVRLTKGEAWHATDPFAAARPDLFDTTPPVVRGVSPEPRRRGRPPKVEQATAAPGEVRDAG